MTSRTRYLAGTVAALATTLAALPFVGVGTAGAAITAGELALTDVSPWYLGDTVEIGYTDGDEVGPYKFTLWDLNDTGVDDDKRIATIAAGDEIDGLSAQMWSIPASMKKLAGEGLEIRLESSTVPAAFDAVKSDPVDILESGVSAVTGATGTGGLKPGGEITVEWTSAGVVGSTVNIGLVSADGKKKVALANGVANVEDDTNTASNITLPATIAAGDYKVVVTPVLKSAGASTSAAAVTLAAITGPAVTGTASVARGATFTYASTAASSTTPVDFVLRDKTSKKAVLKLATKVTVTTSQTITVPYSVQASTNLEIVASFSGVKDSEGTPANVTVTTPAVGTPTVTTKSSGWANQLELVTVTFTGGGPTNTISLVKGTKVIPLLAKVAAGTYKVEIPATAAAGSGYTIVVSNDSLKKTETNYSTASSAFAIAANATKLG